MQREKKFKVTTLGCRTNQYESQAYHDQLLAMGYQAAAPEEQADICIVNTCTVTESADSSSRHEIRQLIRQNPEAKIVVTGCFAERQPDLMEKLPGVTHLIPNKEKENLLAHLFPEMEIPEFAIKQFEAHTRAFVKIQDGCNSFCTYCIIPYVRGRSRSRKISEIVQEIEGLIANGFQEVVLTGINIGDFEDQDLISGKTYRLADLIRIVDQVPGLKRLRVSSIDPDEVDDDLADAILNGKNCSPSMHIVLQSGSNHILKRMNRKYTRQIFLDTIDRLRTACPDFTFTTDLIVGFPGETELDIEETIEIMREVKFAKVHLFPYSSRPRTRAALFPDQVGVEEIKVRKQKLLRLAEQFSFDLRQEYIGRTMEILVEGGDEGKDFWRGHTNNFLMVKIPKEDSEIGPNQIISVYLKENSPDGLIGSKDVRCVL